MMLCKNPIATISFGVLAYLPAGRTGSCSNTVDYKL